MGIERPEPDEFEELQGDGERPLSPEDEELQDVYARIVEITGTTEQSEAEVIAALKDMDIGDPVLYPTGNPSLWAEVTRNSETDYDVKEHVT